MIDGTTNQPTVKAYLAAQNPVTMRVAVVVPSYKVSRHILSVIDKIGPEVAVIYVVDDACPEQSGKFVEDNCNDPRVRVVYSLVNQGVGGAMVAGYLRALSEGADVVIKVDGDGQMDPQFIPLLIRPILEGRSDYAKGNRFFRLESLQPMPPVRIFGNAVLSFLAKLSTGYWNVFDPTNGYTAIHAKVLAELPLEKIHKRYFFETDMLFRMNTLRCVVADVPMKAIYGDEASNLKVNQVIPEFLWNHWINFCKRLFYNYLLRDFSIFTIQFFVGLLMILFGTVFGATMWYHFASIKVAAPSGVVMIAALPIMVGIQFVLSFLNWDAQNIPTSPLHRRL